MSKSISKSMFSNVNLKDHSKIAYKAEVELNLIQNLLKSKQS